MHDDAIRRFIPHNACAGFRNMRYAWQVKFAIRKKTLFSKRFIIIAYHVAF